MNVREWALPVYTILMQLAIGALFTLWMIRTLAVFKFDQAEIDRISRNPLLVIVFTAAVAMTAAHFHLSKPFQSYLAILNFKTSWLSREIAFSILFFLTLLSVLYLVYLRPECQKLIAGLGWLSILLGSVLIYCMARIYLLPTQVAWNSTTVILSFYTTALLLGAVALTCIFILDLKFAEIQKTQDVEQRAGTIKYYFGGLAAFIMALSVVSLIIIYTQIYQLGQGDLIARTSLSLLVELYLPLFVLRQILLVGAALMLGYSMYRLYKLKISPQGILVPVYISCLLFLVGEIVGRFLFYATHIRVGL